MIPVRPERGGGSVTISEARDCTLGADWEPGGGLSVKQTIWGFNLKPGKPSTASFQAQ